MHDLILWLGARFSPEQYLFWTRIQSVAWSCADVLIVFLLLRIANLGRALLGVRPHRISYAVLCVTLPLVPLLAVAPSGAVLFRLELLITLPHFLLVLYVIFANIFRMPEVLGKLAPLPAQGEALGPASQKKDQQAPVEPMA